MNRNNHLKRGSAIALCLVFATVLLMMGLAYSKLTTNSKRQTVQIDERIKLEYLAHGMTELALLKFQLYPADYYACAEAASYGSKVHLEDFTINAEEFQIKNDQNSKSSFNETGLNLFLTGMNIVTNNKWNNEVLYITASATYTDQFNRTIDKGVTRIVDLNRRTVNP